MEINLVTVSGEPAILWRVAVMSALIYPFVAGFVLWFQFKRTDHGLWNSSSPYLMALVPAAFTLGIAWLALAAAVRAVSIAGAGAIFAAAVVSELVQPAILGAALSLLLVIIVALVNHLRSRQSSVGRIIAGSRVPVGVVLLLGLITVLLVFFSLDLVGRAPATPGNAVHFAMAAVCVLASLALFGSSLVPSKVGRAKPGSSLLVAVVLVLVLGADGAILYALSWQMYGLAIGV